MDEPGEPARMDHGEETDVEGGAPGAASSDDASADDASADDAAADGPQLPPAVDLGRRRFGWLRLWRIEQPSKLKAACMFLSKKSAPH